MEHPRGLGRRGIRHVYIMRYSQKGAVTVSGAETSGTWLGNIIHWDLLMVSLDPQTYLSGTT